MGKKRIPKNRQKPPDPATIMGAFGGHIQEQVAANIERHQRYKVIATMINELPDDGQWTEKQRDRWLAALTASLDYSVDIVPDPQDYLADRGNSS
jgi:hypothetical protein